MESAKEAAPPLSEGGCGQQTPQQSTDSTTEEARLHINTAVFQGVHYPTPFAAAIAKEALRSAQQYYNLFFTATSEEEREAQQHTEGGGVMKAQEAAAGGASSSDAQKTGKTLHKRNSGRSVHVDPTVSSTGAGRSSPTSQPSDGVAVNWKQASNEGEEEDEAETSVPYTGPSVRTPLKVHNTPYHTFFPPVLSPRRRERIVEKIVRHKSRPYSSWKWKKAEDYYTLHTQNVQHNNAYKVSPLPAVPGGAPAVPLGPSVLAARTASPKVVATATTTVPFKVTAAVVAEAAAAARAERHPASSTSANVPSIGDYATGGAAVKAGSGTGARPAPSSSSSSPVTTSTETAAVGGGGGADEAIRGCPQLGGSAGSPVIANDAVPFRPGSASPAQAAGTAGGQPISCSEGDSSVAASPADRASPTIGRNATEGNAAGNAVEDSDALARSCPPPSSILPPNIDIVGESSVYTIPASQQGPEYFTQAAEDGTKTLIIIMVGLPARGKTFLAQKICRLLGWHGSRAKVQNIQVAWRRVLLDWEASQRAVDEMRTTYKRDKTVDDSVTGRQASDVLPASRTSRETSPVPSLNSPYSPHGAGTPALPTSPRLAAAGATTAASTGHLRAEHFQQLIKEPDSMARRLYRYVLKSFADDCKLFFAHGGEVVVINDDFVTEELRDEAEALFKPLASQLFYMEVIRSAEENKRFNECKVDDPTEYPKSSVSATEARVDFDDRVAFLESVYEPIQQAAPRDPSATSSSSSDEEDDPDEKLMQDVHATSSGAKEASRAPATLSQTNGAAGARPVAPQPPRSGPRRVRRSRSPKRYIKIRNSNTIETNGISGYAASRIISYVMNLTQVKIQHPIYFVRHGESCFNLEDRIGGNPLLTAQGMRDAAALLEFLDSLKRHLHDVDDKQKEVKRAGGVVPVCALSFAATPAAPSSNSNTTTNPSVSNSTSSNSASNTAVAATMETPMSAPPPPPSSSSHLAHTVPPLTTPTLGSVVSAPATAASSPHIRLHRSNAENLEIWTSQLRRAIQTAELSERLLNIKTLRWSSLNEIHAGVCEDMTYAEVAQKYPLIDYFRKQSKYTFRYPEGESYQDLVVRLEPVIMELENADKVVVVVAHQAVLRCLLAYFGSTSAESSVRVRVPHRTVWRCTYDSKGIASLDEIYLDNADAGFPSAAPLRAEDFPEIPTERTGETVNGI